MKFTFIGIYNDKQYELSGDGVTDIYGHYISFHHDLDYYAIGAARGIQQYVKVPDGSPFNHYFDGVKIYVGDLLIAEVFGKSLYRYTKWP